MVTNCKESEFCLYIPATLWNDTIDRQFIRALWTCLPFPLVGIQLHRILATLSCVKLLSKKPKRNNRSRQLVVLEI